MYRSTVDATTLNREQSIAYSTVQQHQPQKFEHEPWPPPLQMIVALLALSLFSALQSRWSSQVPQEWQYLIFMVRPCTQSCSYPFNPQTRKNYRDLHQSTCKWSWKTNITYSLINCFVKEHLHGWINVWGKLLESDEPMGRVSVIMFCDFAQLPSPFLNHITD